MIGVLIDVSGSMETAFNSIDKSQRSNVKRIHAIFTSLMNVVHREVAHHNRQESIFVSSFGMGKIFPETCDLVALLECFPEDGHNDRSKQRLIALAAKEGAPHAEQWIRKYITDFEARFLHRCLTSDRSALRELISKIPSPYADSAAQMYSTAR